jgi:large subunit ribosomal protein L10
LLRKEKERVVEELRESLQGTTITILSDYRGLSVAEMTSLRNQLRQASVNYRVVKNTLIRLALKETDLEPLIDQIDGPTAVAFSRDDPISPAKVLGDFSKNQPKLEIKGGMVEGKIVDSEGVKQLAQIPSREELLGKLVSLLHVGPTRLVTVLSANLQNLLQVLNAIRQQKG